MAVNRDKTDRWKEDIAQSVDMYNRKNRSKANYSKRRGLKMPRENRDVDDG